MKQCPHCHAPMEEDAHICLYCMSETEQKPWIPDRVPTSKKRIGVIAALLVAAAGGIAALLWRAPLFFAGDAAVSSSETSAVTASTTDLSPSASTTADSVTEAGKTDPTSAKTTDSMDDAAEKQPIFRTQRVETGADGSEYLPVRPSEGLMIVGVETPSASGVYVIPEKIGEECVVALSAEAFCDPAISPTIKTVVLPAWILKVPDGTFSACTKLTDLYIAAEHFSITAAAFSPDDAREGTLTLHSSDDCAGGSGYLSLTAPSYGAVWAFWDKTTDTF